MTASFSQYTGPALLTLCAIIILFFIRLITLRMATRWAERTETRGDDIVIESIRVPSFYWCVAIGLHTGVIFSDLPERYVRHLSMVIYVIVIISVTFTVASLAGRVFKEYLQKTELPIPSTGLAYGILMGTILMAGFLILLNYPGISIAPLLTALGVGGLAVALALQDTLANRRGGERDSFPPENGAYQGGKG